MKKPAFTFLELLVAITLFGVGMLSLVEVIPVNRKFITQSSQTTQAAFLAQEKMEEMRSLTYDSLPAGTFESKGVVNNTGGNTFQAFQRQTIITNIDNSWATTGSETGLRKVVVTVFWDEGNGERQYSLSSFIYEK